MNYQLNIEIIELNYIYYIPLKKLFKNGIHEVRGSIPLVSTNLFNSLGHLERCSFAFGSRAISSPDYRETY